MSHVVGEALMHLNVQIDNEYDGRDQLTRESITGNNAANPKAPAWAP